jgi:hypothetical protein
MTEEEGKGKSGIRTKERVVSGARGKSGIRGKRKEWY